MKRKIEAWMLLTETGYVIAKSRSQFEYYEGNKGAKIVRLVPYNPNNARVLKAANDFYVALARATHIAAVTPQVYELLNAVDRRERRLKKGAKR